MGTSMIKFINQITLLSVLLMAGCDIRENEIAPGLSFTKIYNTESFTDTFYPLDVVQTSDSAYLMLSATDSWTPYLLKADTDGNYDWHQALPEPFVNPLQQIYRNNEALYMVCMDELNLGTYILELDPAGGQPDVVFNSPDIEYPLAASVTPDGGWLIQSFDREARRTRLTKLTPAYDVEWEQDFNIMEDVEEKVIKHLTRTGKRLPFFCGFAAGGGNSGYYYFNGFHNFTISLTFVNPADGEMLGVMNGFRDLEYINALQPLSNGSTALAKNSYGDNFLLPQATVNSRTVSSSAEFTTNGFPEIDPAAPIIIKNTQIMNREISLFATHTKSKRISLYAYDAEDGSLQDVLYLGQSAPYEIGSFARTSDGGLVVLGRTFVGGRFPRLCLFKLTAAEVENLL
jgi:hypothetical protein